MTQMNYCRCMPFMSIFTISISSFSIIHSTEQCGGYISQPVLAAIYVQYDSYKCNSFVIFLFFFLTKSFSALIAL